MKKAMNSTITDQRYQIEKATCAVTFAQIRLGRAITSFPARQGPSSSESQSARRCVCAARQLPFMDDLAVTIKPPTGVPDRIALVELAFGSCKSKQPGVVGISAYRRSGVS